jgi:hypothetical protein
VPVSSGFSDDTKTIERFLSDSFTLDMGIRKSNVVKERRNHHLIGEGERGIVTNMSCAQKYRKVQVLGRNGGVSEVNHLEKRSKRKPDSNNLAGAEEIMLIKSWEWEWGEINRDGRRVSSEPWTENFHGP